MRRSTSFVVLLADLVLMPAVSGVAAHADAPAASAATVSTGKRVVGEPLSAAGAAPLAVQVTKAAPPGAGDGEKALDQSFQHPWIVRLARTKKKQRLRTCRDYLDLKTDEIETETPDNPRGFLQDAANCQALKWLREARASRKTFLDGFHLDQGAPRMLPADFYLDIAPDDEERIQTAARTGQTLKAFDPQVRVRAAGAAGDHGTIRLTGDGYQEEVIEYGRGDFNGDGIEDVLLLRIASPEGGTLTDFTLFLLGRANDKGPLRVLRTWRQGA